MSRDETTESSLLDFMPPFRPMEPCAVWYDNKIRQLGDGSEGTGDNATTDVGCGYRHLAP